MPTNDFRFPILLAGADEEDAAVAAILERSAAAVLAQYVCVPTDDFRAEGSGAASSSHNDAATPRSPNSTVPSSSMRRLAALTSR